MSEATLMRILGEERHHVKSMEYIELMGSYIYRDFKKCFKADCRSLVSCVAHGLISAPSTTTYGAARRLARFMFDRSHKVNAKRSHADPLSKVRHQTPCTSWERKTTSFGFTFYFGLCTWKCYDLFEMKKPSNHKWLENRSQVRRCASVNWFR
jgi:hypothetical protein